MKSNPSNRLTVKESSELFGATVETVKQWIADGLPHTKEQKGGRKGSPRSLIDPTEARAWLIEHGQRRFLNTDLKNTIPKISETTQAVKNPGVAGASERLRSVEMDAFNDYLKAREDGRLLDQRSYMKLHSEAVKQMLAAEEVADMKKQVEGEVWSEVEQSLATWAAPVKAMVEQMPRSLAARCNVNDPGMAETALRDWVNGQLFPVMNKKPA